MKSISDAANMVEGQPMFKILARANELEALGRDILHFEIGEPDFSTPKFIVESAKTALDNGDTRYVNSMGIPDLRNAICDRTQKDYGFRPDMEQVAVFTGANPIISFVIQAVMNPGDEVIVQDPGFPTYYSAMGFIGVKPVKVPLSEKNKFRMDPDDIRSRITDKTRLILMNSPQNPTGAVMTKDEVEEVANIAREHDVYLLTDEIYGKMTYDEEHHSPTLSDHCKERVIMLNGWSKAYSMTGWRLGYAIGPPVVIEKMGLISQTLVSCVPPFIQRAGIAALTGDQSVITTMMGEFRKRRDLIVGGLNSLPGVTCIKPEGAFYAFPNISGTGLTCVEFSDLMLEEAGVAACPGMYFGDCGKGFVRFSYASSLLQIEQAIEKMGEVLRKRV